MLYTKCSIMPWSWAVYCFYNSPNLWNLSWVVNLYEAVTCHFPRVTVYRIQDVIQSLGIWPGSLWEILSFFQWKAGPLTLIPKKYSCIMNCHVSGTIGGLRARTIPWFFGHFWKCSEVVDNYFWTLSKMAEKSRDHSCSEPFNCSCIINIFSWCYFFWAGWIRNHQI